ncbi:4-trimethylaminobutyraldehyde dehydrogenase [Anabrus simplex]|uniref:4-trimethylaminobutyraldehyde dehydrogenase n=1 Tax=Anabrus simplex TaxID=316456 RepID=UPI0034DD0D62
MVVSRINIWRILSPNKIYQKKYFSTAVKGPFNHIGGAKTACLDAIRDVPVREPSTGNSLCNVPASGANEVDRAVTAASQAFRQWSKFSNSERGRVLLSAGGKIRQYLEEIARVEVRNTGKPIWEARLDIASCADAFEYFGGIIASLAGQHIPLHNDTFAMVLREPLGVIAGIGAWNYPLQSCSWKAAPALACGNTMVFKPSQFTPLTALMLADLLSESGVPEGVFNVIQGEETTGSLLCQHPGIAKISFTGSVATGVKVMTAAAAGLKKVTLELGGKSPLIIFDDADMTNALKGSLLANFLSQGEVCSNGTRVFVQETIASQFLDKLVEATKKLKIGDPYAEDTVVGATISKEHAEKVLKYIEDAKKEGAKVMCGGERIHLPSPLDGGYYLSPCVLANCHDGMRVVQEEVFGAVLSFLTFSTEEEVLKRANDTMFGLAGGVFTRDLQRAIRVVHKLQAGTVWINNFNVVPLEIPFGGYKQSGIGRENGTAALDNYTQLKTVYVESGDVDCGPLLKD